MLAGVSVGVGRAVGADDLDAIRVGFFVLACLTVMAVYLAGALLFGTPGAGILAAATFVTFKGFAIDALGGPNAKTPAVLFGMLATVLLVRRQFFWGAFVASLALLVWQPFAIYVLVAVAGAWLDAERGDRLRSAVAAVAGATIPVAATALYFLASGALGDLVEVAVLLPLTGIERGETPFVQHLRHLIAAVHGNYGPSAWVLWAGLACMIGLIGVRAWENRLAIRSLARDPMITIVLPPLVFIGLFSLVEFQGYPDAYPFLPYAALGLAGALAGGLAILEGRGWRFLARSAPIAVSVVVVVGTAAWYSGPRPEASGLARQRTDAAAAERVLGSGTVFSLGDPTPLVLMRRASPSPGIFLSSGVDQWIVEHTPGGFDGWRREIRSARPGMILIGGWGGRYTVPMRRWLEQRYTLISIGELRAFVPRTSAGAGG